MNIELSSRKTCFAVCEVAIVYAHESMVEINTERKIRSQ